MLLADQDMKPLRLCEMCLGGESAAVILPMLNTSNEWSPEGRDAGHPISEVPE